MLSCPGGSTFCINIQTQAAYPTEVVVLGPDGATPGPFTEVPGGVSGFRDFDNGNGTYAAFPVQTETNSSANVFGYATVEDSITSESTGQTWTFGPQVIEPVLPGQTVGGYPGGYQGTAPFPSGTFEATACLWVGPALPWGSEEAPYTTGTPSCVTTEVTN
jgi:hypothetical protein